MCKVYEILHHLHESNCLESWAVTGWQWAGGLLDVWLS